jgi:pimeloyl-ACP methyl ester carboxylesterase
MEAVPYLKNGAVFFMRTEPSFDIQSIDLNGYAQAYVDLGTGPAVLLIHGSLCDCRYWKAQLGALSKSFRVISVSLRHYWPEKWDGRGEDFTVDQHCADMQALLGALGVEEAHVVGHSRGARVALEMALRADGRLRSLTLADPGVTFPDSVDSRGAFREEALAAIANGDIEAGLARFVDCVSGADTWRRMVPWFRQMARDNATTLIGQVADRPAALSAQALGAVKMPTLLIGGAMSPAPYPAILDTLENALPGSTRITINGSSHGMNLGNPRAFNEAVTTFIGRTAASA